MKTARIQNDLRARLKGNPISKGFGVGRPVFLKMGTNRFSRIEISTSEVAAEIERLHIAADRCVQQLNDLSHSDSTGIAEIQLLILNSSLTSQVEATIREDKVNAEWALSVVAERSLERQAETPDERFRDKAADIEDVASRLLRTLRGSVSSINIPPRSVIIARDLRPSAMIELAKCDPAAIITERGGWTSHSSILAREFRIPMVSGVHNIEDLDLSPGYLVSVNGSTGDVAAVANPGTTIGSSVHDNADRSHRHDRQLTTSDGVEITIRLNADFPGLYDRAFGARGIGLYRSETLVDGEGRFPTEDDQVAAYSEMARSVGTDPLRIRTFDIAVDQVSGGRKLPEQNPALGLRSTRLCLFKTNDFRTQVRAILRVAADFNVDLILPMISNLEEVTEAKRVIDEETVALGNEGQRCGSPAIGLMVEVPSVVLIAREFARVVDFLCLGTNDLVQYLLAVDRDNDAVAGWYQTLHPAVLRAIEQVLKAAEEEHKPVEICGEMAASPFYIPVLIGLGARELSMNVGALDAAHKLIAGISQTACAALVEHLRGRTTASAIERDLNDFYLQEWPHLFDPDLVGPKN